MLRETSQHLDLPSPHEAIRWEAHAPTPYETILTWRAEHAPSGLACTAYLPREPEYIGAFERAAEGYARLDHPHIAQALGLGLIGEQAASTLGLPTATPFALEERVSGASILAHASSWSWEDLLEVFAQLLDGLAQAHARDVLHLAIHPDHVTWSHDRGLILSGFMHSACTPPVHDLAAPEVLRRRIRASDLGPWTDLASVAGLMWWCITGASPFEQSAGLEESSTSQRRRPGALVPRIDVPEGTERWLKRAMSRRPSRRPAHALEMMQGLRDLGSSEASPHWRLPDDWPRSAYHPVWDARVWTIRGAPSVGREDSIRWLWDGLLASQDGVEFRLIEGAQDVDERDFARRFGDAAAAAGAHCLRAAFGQRGALAGFQGMLRRAFRCEKLDRQTSTRLVMDRYLDWRVPESEMREVTALMDVMFGEELTDARHGCSAAERRDALTNFLSRMSKERPLLLLLEDVTSSPRGLDLVDALATRPDLHILVVMTTSTTDAYTMGMRRLEEVDQLTRRTLEAIDASYLLEMAGQGRLSGIERPTLKRILDASLTTTLPHVSELIARWLAIGEVSDEDPGGRWEHAIADIEQKCGASTREVLALATALGPEVSMDQWRRVAESMKVDLPANLVDELARHTLIQRTHGGWRFAASTLYEAAVEAAKAQGIWGQMHLRCARWFTARFDTKSWGVTARVIDHLTEAGRYLEALEHYTRIGWSLFYTESLGTIERFLEMYKTLLDTMEFAPDDAPRAHWMLIHSRYIRNRFGDAERAGEELTKAMTLARRHDLPETEGLAVALTIHLGLGDAAEREELLEQTLARRDWERWPEVYASLLHIRAWAAYGAGDYDDAVAWLERAAHLYEECGALLRRGAALNMLSHALIAAEEYARAEANLERTRALCEELPGARAIYSEYHNASGELRRQQGRYDEARHHYERLIELCMRSKSELNALIGSVNLLINALQARRYDDLAQLFATDLWRDWGGKTPATLRTKTALARAALALWRDEDTGIDEVLAEALEHQHVRGVFDTDVLIGCARVAELARQRGRDDLASRAEAIAQAHRDSFS